MGNEILVTDGWTVSPDAPCASPAYRLFLPAMSVLHHLSRRTAGALALVLACAVLVGSLCPRGWFVCVHGQDIALAGADHADEEHGCTEQDCCPGTDGCLDLAISLVLDDQNAGAPLPVSLPESPMVGLLPDATRGVMTLESPRWIHLGDPPLPDLIRHVRLLV